MEEQSGICEKNEIFILLIMKNDFSKVSFYQNHQRYSRFICLKGYIHVKWPWSDTTSSSIGASNPNSLIKLIGKLDTMEAANSYLS